MGYSTSVSEWNIVQGPSKMDLMLAIFDHSRDKPRPVTFGLRLRDAERPGSPIMAMDIIVTSVERVDTDGDCWDFEGRPVLSDGSNVPGDTGSDKVSGRFGVKTRNGWLTHTETRRD